MRAPQPPTYVPATVEFRGVERQVLLDTYGAVLRAEGHDDVRALSLSAVAERTGIARTLLVDWVDAGHLEGFTLLGTSFAVPDSNGQYPVRTHA